MTIASLTRQKNLLTANADAIAAYVAIARRGPRTDYDLFFFLITDSYVRTRT